MSWLKRGLKRLARSKLAGMALGVVKSTPLGAAAFRVGHTAKQLGAVVKQGRIEKRRGKALNAAVATLANAKRPGLQETPSGRSRDQWISEISADSFAGGSEHLPVTKKKSIWRTSGFKSKAEYDKAQRKQAKAEAGYAPKPRATKKAKPAKTKTKRTLPPHMAKRAAHMKALAVKWRAAGKPMKWIEYVKANPM